MLKSSLDLDRAFDSVIKQSYPYLIFPPPEFRDALAQQLDSLCQYYRERNDIAFTERVEIVKRMLNEAIFDDLTGLKIYYFEYQQKSIDECFRKIEERLSKLEKTGKSVGKSGRLKKEDVSESGTRNERLNVDNSQVTSIESIVTKNTETLTETEALTGVEPLTETKPQMEESVLVTMEVTNNQDKLDTQVHNTDIVKDCLRLSKASLTSDDLSSLTGLPYDKARDAVNNLITKTCRQNIKIDYVIRPRKYGNTMRNLRVASYSWIENE